MKKIIKDFLMQIRLSITSKIIQSTPGFLRLYLKRLGLQPLLNAVISNKEGELIYQTTWVSIFKQNKGRVNAYWRKYLFLEKVIKRCKITARKKVLDVGCGISSVLHFVDGKRYGIDPLADFYILMYDYPNNINIRKGIGEKIPFPSSFFDIVFCVNALDHAHDPVKVVNEVARVLEKKGFFIIYVDIFDDRIKRDPVHIHSFIKEQVRDLVHEKFEIVEEHISRQLSEADLFAFIMGKKLERKQKGMLLIMQKI